ncbi:hypothetical protein [Flavobacterium lacisediminis]|uniref:Uncharacterized protein n=1 Tax=Flavobacterium lacisediminis TaxID=2989705 RepID=A0ABT3EHL2_9FLAO|nr:hypothetical protein [Flavobacterium lacisediminis]MCW1148069.1 hypothetical protein [Flavobacterium lacisediminis]
MIKKVIILFLFFQLGFGQKVINDSLISKFEKDLVYKAIEISRLPDLRNDTLSDFYFRLNYAGLKIDLYKDDYGKLILKSTQYYTKIKNSIITDTIVFTKLHDSKIAIWLHTYVSNSKLEDMIPSKKSNFGKAGVFMSDDYYLEFSNKKKYVIKSFPFSDLDTISENYSLKDLINDLFEKIEIEKLKKEFREDLPGGYSYSNELGYLFYKLHNSFVILDYLGDYRLSFGFISYYYVNKIAKKRFNLGASINYQVGFNGNSSVKTSVNKYNLFSDNRSYSDLIRFSYEKHDLDYIKSVEQFENYKINYALSIDKYFNFGISYNQLVIDSRFNGLDLSISKNIESIELKPYYEINLYENHLTNYVVGVSKTIKFNIHEKPIRMYSNLYYEKLFDFKSLNFSLQIPLLNFGLN